MVKIIVTGLLLYLVYNHNCFAQEHNTSTVKSLLFSDSDMDLKWDSLYSYPTNSNNQIWVVYSDRNENYTYRDKLLKAPKDTLGFMEKFYVKEKTENLLHIVRDPQIGDDGTFSSFAYDCGWISENNLLLSTHCLLNKKTKLDLKALPIITNSKEFDIKSYSDPGLVSFKSEISGLYNFYVYKMTGNSLLLGTTHKILDHKNDSKKILGWVAANDFEVWYSNIAIIPNMSVLGRDMDTLNCKVFKNPKSASGFDLPKAVNGKHVLYNRNYIAGEEKPIDIFPLLGYDNDYLRVAVKKDILTPTGSISNDRYLEINKSVNEILMKHNRINYYFVIDATASMQIYIDYLADKLQELIIQLLIQNRDYNGHLIYRFGIVVYRDENEKSGAIEILPLTHDYSSITKFLKSIRAYSLHDLDFGESVNLGLFNALKNFPQGETNNIILIGDSGNHRRLENTISKDDVLSELKNKDCNLFVIQVYKRQRQDLIDFILDQKELIIQKSIADLENAARLNTSNNVIDTTKLLTQQGDNRLVVNSPYSLGSIYYPSSINTLMSPEEISSEITRIFLLVDDFIKSNYEYIENVLRGSQMDEKAFSKTIYSLSRIEGMDEDIPNALFEKKMQYFEIGYVLVKLFQEENAPYEFACRISRERLFFIIHILRNLTATRYETIMARRSQLVMMFKEINMVVSETENISTVYNLSVGQILNKAFGIPILSQQKFDDLTLKDLTHPGLISDKDINSMLEYFQHSLMKLQEYAYDTGNVQESSSKDNSYYWLPIRLLPHFSDSQSIIVH
jgi:hypothetical protein